MEPDCIIGTPSVPTISTSVMSTSVPIINSMASTVYKNYVCRGNETIIKIPSQYFLFAIDVYYGVTSDNTCKTIK